MIQNPLCWHRPGLEGVRGWGPEDLQKALERDGRGFDFSKIDWADVYKHILTIDSDYSFYKIFLNFTQCLSVKNNVYFWFTPMLGFGFVLTLKYSHVFFDVSNSNVYPKANKITGRSSCLKHGQGLKVMHLQFLGGLN